MVPGEKVKILISGGQHGNSDFLILNDKLFHLDSFNQYKNLPIKTLSNLLYSIILHSQSLTIRKFPMLIFISFLFS